MITRQIDPAEGFRGSHAPLMLYVGGDFSGREDDSISFEYREFLTQFISEMCSLPAEDATKVFSGLEDLSVGPLRSMEVGECTSDELSMRLEQMFNTNYRQACVLAAESQEVISIESWSAATGQG